ncbi:hypothetical protein NMG60_11005796 [Bertholletia excelsa]
MDGFHDYYKPVVAMVAMQFAYAGLAISTRAALLQGMSPRVFVFYRHCIATLVMAPIAYFARKDRSSLGSRSFCLIFLASLVGVTINQNIYFEGIYLASSSMASAMSNLVPAITFVIASILGLEKINFRSLRSVAKIVGTVICVVGAVSMTLLRGPKLLNSELLPIKSLLSSGSENWLLGSFLLFGSCCCWSFWIIFQVPVSVSHPDHLSLSAWTCFMATLQSGIVALFLEPDQAAWKLHSYLELACCFYAGLVGSAAAFFVQAWCISQRGPLFCAMFSPLSTVTVTIFAAIFLHEEVYIGSLISAVGVIAGLYVVLWGKAEDLQGLKLETNLKRQVEEAQAVKVIVDESLKRTCNVDLEEPLLSDKSKNAQENLKH